MFDWRRQCGVPIASGDGQTVDAGFFDGGQSLWQGDGIHANPRFYKYDWRIWTRADLEAQPPDGPRGEPVVPEWSFAAAMVQLRTLYMTGEVFLVRSRRRYRQGVDLPFDFSRIDAAECAPAYDDDHDPPFHGHR